MPIHAFTTKQVQALTGLSERMLLYWAQTGVYEAAFVDERPRIPYRRIYDFRDLVGLRTLALLRKKHRVNLDELRKTGDYLRAMSDRPWSEMTFGVVGKTVVFRVPGSDEWMTAIPQGQTVMRISVAEVARSAERDASDIARRPHENVGKVVRHRHVLSNAWRLAGTRIPTSAVWNLTEAGYRIEDVIDAYPDLTPEDVEAALSHEKTMRTKQAA